MKFQKTGSVMVSYAFLMIILLNACGKKEDEVDPIPEPQSCSLKGVVTGSSSVTITRNDKGLPIRLDYSNPTTSTIPSSTCLIEYDALGNAIKMTEGNNYFSYEYDANKKPVSRSLYRRKDSTQPFQKNEQIYYRYNELNLIDTVILSEFSYERYEYDANKNLLKKFVKDVGQAEVLSTEYLSFDDKKNPKSDCNFRQYFFLVVPTETVTGLELPWPGDHNVLSKKVRLAGGDFVNVTSTYQYNSLGYPIANPETNAQFQYDCK